MKLALITGGENIGAAVHRAISQMHAQSDVQLVDIKDAYIEESIPITMPYKFLDTNGEKKKKKPCTYHEYTNRGKVEVSSNMYTEIWKCRHCEHPLK